MITNNTMDTILKNKRNNTVKRDEGAIVKQLLSSYNSVSGYISPEERSRMLKEHFKLSHGKHKKKRGIK